VISEIVGQLKGGDRRSIGAVPKVVDQALANPPLFSKVFAGMDNADPVVRMPCGDAVEKITARNPAYLRSYKRHLIQLAQTAKQQEVRWHIAQLFSRLRLSASQRRKVATILSGYLTDKSRIVKTFSMQALAHIAANDVTLRAPILRQLRHLVEAGSPAMRSRGRKLLASLKRE